MDTLKRPRPRPATSLVELMVALSIAATLAGVALLQASLKPNVPQTAFVSLQAQVQHARELAKTSGNGSTIVIVPGSGTFTSTLYSGRPNGGTFSAIAVDTYNARAAFSSALAGSNSLTIFFSASNTATAANWNTGNGTITTQPVCTTSINFTISYSSQSLPGAIGCFDPRLVP